MEGLGEVPCASLVGKLPALVLARVFDQLLGVYMLGLPLSLFCPVSSINLIVWTVFNTASYSCRLFNNLYLSLNNERVPWLLM